MQNNLIKTAPGSTALVFTKDQTGLLGVIRRWHDDEHPDGWVVCMHPLCHAAQQFVSDRMDGGDQS